MIQNSNHWRVCMRLTNELWSIRTVSLADDTAHFIGTFQEQRHEKDFGLPDRTTHFPYRHH